MNLSKLFTKTFVIKFKRLEQIRQEANEVRATLLFENANSDNVVKNLRKHDSLREVFNEEKYWWMTAMKRVDTYGGTR